MKLVVDMEDEETTRVITKDEIPKTCVYKHEGRWVFTSLTEQHVGLSFTGHFAVQEPSTKTRCGTKAKFQIIEDVGKES